MDEWRAKSTRNMGLANTRGVHSEMSQERRCMGSAIASGRGVSEIGRAEGMRVEEGHLMPDHVNDI